MDQRNPLTQGKPQEAKKQPRGWPIVLDWLRSPPHAFAAPTSAALMILGLLFVIFSVVAVLRLGWGLVYGSNQEALEAARVFLPLAAAAVGLPLIIWRLVILNRQTRTAEEKTQIDRETHYTSIFSKSVEQLGATREHKETTEGDSGPNARSWTIPNIEVRLGGIHSLSRLAEASSLDVPKIENMLRSYIRQNSWYKTNGARHQIFPHDTFISTPDEFTSFENEVPEKDFQEKLIEWSSSIRGHIVAVKDWSAQINETRVDISEAIASIARLEHRADKREILENCLFTGETIPTQIADKYIFSKSKFINCTFNISGEESVRFNECILVDCELFIDRAYVQFESCKIYESSVYGNDSSGISFGDSYIFDVRVSFKKDTITFVASRSVFRVAHISSGETRMMLWGNIFVDTVVSESIVSDDSVIELNLFIDSPFHGVDLSGLDEYDLDELSTVKADRRTLHPGEIRPSTWPAYDPTNIDDDIPF